MEPQEKASEKVSYKDTLNLPRTDFPIRANLAADEPLMLARWEKEKIYSKTFWSHQGNEKFVLHDGPPFSNGHIHLGHAFNKIHKDLVAKSQRMFAKQVPIQPGWDCHGMPIEIKVTKEKPGLSSKELRTACRAYANEWVNIQRQEFKNLAVFMDWDRPYKTMDSDYEASIVEAFGIFVKNGYIERKHKTVPWCASCQTVLAISEIEYEDRKDPSLYIAFSLTPESAQALFPQLKDKKVSLAVWTTTPWTLPLNRAVLVRPGAQYVILDIGSHGYALVGKDLAAQLCTAMGIEPVIIAQIKAEQLVGHSVQHPFDQSRVVPVIADQMVSLDEGTAFVHCAPGCGPIDYEVAVKNNLEIYSPITPDGKYAQEIVPQELKGMAVSDGQIWAIKQLTERGMLLAKKSITHSYPHCWRCHQGLIFRATKQWFCDLSRHELKDRVLRAIDGIQMIPAPTKNRLYTALEGRLEWCLSRQRAWGVPIAALLCTKCDYAYCDPAFIESVQKGVAQHGIEYWDDVTVEQLLPPHFKCPDCGNSSWKKERDTLDVWFDSGLSHFAVLKKNAELAFPADLYLEAKDQHRGWFQSSLLTSIALENESCVKTIITHGFTVDEHGRKMSKSLGNVVAPQAMIEKLGIDGLRLWASSIDYGSDIVASDVLVRNVQEVYRKIRNTARFLLSNLYDFDIATDAVKLTDMHPIDVYAMQQLYELNQSVLNAYKEYDFTAVFHALAHYCSVDLSAFYLDIVKDRLYVEAARGKERRAAQTVCWYILDTLTRLMAPILSITAEQISDLYLHKNQKSIHEHCFARLPHVWGLLSRHDERGQDLIVRPVYFGDEKEVELPLKNAITIRLAETWEALLLMRGALLKAIEAQREKGLIKHSLEVCLCVFLDNNDAVAHNVLAFFAGSKQQSLEDFLREFLIVSQVTVKTNADSLEETTLPWLHVSAERAQGVKCPRCWQITNSSQADGLCARCAPLV